MTEQVKQKIRILDSQTANAIAAGEVVERPASVVKELVENSIDAGANKIDIEIENGGVRLIKISDNGKGMSADDLPLAFERHSTSKLLTISDLDTISSMGFRGEALASIAAVSKIKIASREEESDKALQLLLEAGEISEANYIGHPEGTSIEVKELFYNTPARFKFLKSDRSETAYILDIVSKLALVHPEISFRLKDKQKELLHTPGNNDLRSVIYLLWGAELAKGMHPLEAELDGIHLHGYLARADLSRHNRSRQLIFVNQRYIQSQLIRQAIEEAGKTWFMKGRHAQVILFINLPGTEVDVNVHPQKTEVRFSDERKVFSLVYHALKDRYPEISKVPGIARENDSLAKTGKFLPAQMSQQQISIKEQFSSRGKAMESPQDGFITEPKQSKKAVSAIAEENQGNKEDLKIYPAADTSQNLSSERLYHEEQSAYFIERGRLESEANSKDEQLPLTKDEHTEAESALLGQLANARLIGQAFKTYLIFEAADQLFLLDQHAAHERIIYEELQKKRQENNQGRILSEELLAPQQIELEASELSLAMELQAEFEKEGYVFSSLGANTIVLREIPLNLSSRLSAEKAFRTVLKLAKKGSFSEGDLHDEIDQDMACKAAIKAHDNLSYDEMKTLVKDLLNCRNPYHCPHGRPIIINIREYDLEKLFKRVV